MMASQTVRAVMGEAPLLQEGAQAVAPQHQAVMDVRDHPTQGVLIQVEEDALLLHPAAHQAGAAVN